ncbi:MAG: hypothetical protein H7233_10120 [Pseudorhodobacter sp.]|nr:hypothetical protein [Frankiaceae bacterium]
MTTLRQLRALLALRWQMIRTPGVRLALCLGVLALAYLLVQVAGVGSHLEKAALATAVKLAPEAFLGFGVLAVVAPLTTGGGNELFPPDQLVAHPVTPRTQFAGGLLLAPVNLVWVLQIFALVGETAFLTAGGSGLLGGLTTAAYVAAATVLGQSLAWTVAGLRQTRRGRQVVAGTGLAGLLGALAVVRSGAGDRVLSASPTRTVVRGVVAGGQGHLGRWALTTGALVLALTVGLLLGARACSWALRRPGDVGASRATSDVRRRPVRGGPLRELVAMDRASVWRAPALRRGALVLAVLPGLVAAGAAVPWASLVVLPGLVAAGAGLLFGVNAFCLDGSGAVWMASLPHDPRLVARSKTIVLAETVGVAILVSALAGSLRSPGAPTGTEIVAIAVSALACGVLVVATCLALSVRRPHRADLSGPRDAVAPPGALALASVRLAAPAGFVGICLEGASQSGQWWAPVLLATPVLVLSALWLRRSLDLYAEPVRRSRIVQVVSAG